MEQEEGRKSRRWHRNIKKQCLKLPAVVFSQIRLEIVSDTGRELIEVVHYALLQIYMAIHAADRPIFVDVVLSTDVSADTESFFFAGGVALLSVFCLVLTKTETGNQFNFLVAAERQIAQSVDAIVLDARRIFISVIGVFSFRDL